METNKDTSKRSSDAQDASRDAQVFREMHKDAQVMLQVIIKTHKNAQDAQMMPKMHQRLPKETTVRASLNRPLV